MKIKQILFTFCALSIFTFSCNKNDEDNFIGTWEAVAITKSACNDTSEDGTFQDLGCNSEDSSCLAVNLELKTDGTYDYNLITVISNTDFNYTYSGTYTFTGNEAEFCSTSGYCFNGEFANSQLTLFRTDDPDNGCDTEIVFEES